MRRVVVKPTSRSGYWNVWAADETEAPRDSAGRTLALEVMLTRRTVSECYPEAWAQIVPGLDSTD